MIAPPACRQLLSDIEAGAEAAVLEDHLVLAASSHRHGCKVVQKAITKGSSALAVRMFKQLKIDVVAASNDEYACRVVQTAIDNIERFAEALEVEKPVPWLLKGL